MNDNNSIAARQPTTLPTSSPSLQIGSNNDIATILTTKAPSLVVMSKGNEKNQPVEVWKIVAALVMKAQKQLNYGRQMDEETIIELSHEIVKDFYYFKLEDIVLCLKLGVKGDFGDTYQNFNPTVVYKWLRSYEQRRHTIAENASIRAAQEQRGALMTTDEARRLYQHQSAAFHDERPATMTNAELQEEARRQRQALSEYLAREGVSLSEMAK